MAFMGINHQRRKVEAGSRHLELLKPVFLDAKKIVERPGPIQACHCHDVAAQHLALMCPSGCRLLRCVKSIGKNEHGFGVIRRHTFPRVGFSPGMHKSEVAQIESSRTMPPNPSSCSSIRLLLFQMGPCPHLRPSTAVRDSRMLDERDDSFAETLNVRDTSCYRRLIAEGFIAREIDRAY